MQVGWAPPPGIPARLWLPQTSRSWWFAGLIAVGAVVVVGVVALDLWAVSAIGYTRTLGFVINLFEAFLLGFGAFVWIQAVPMPAPDLFLSPEGIRFANPVQARAVPWGQIGLVGRVLFVTSRWGPHAAYSLDPARAAWFRAYLATMPVPG